MEEEKKKRKKKLIIIIICIAIALFGAIGAAVPFVLSSSSKSTTNNVVNVYVSAYKVSTHSEIKVSEEKIGFKQEDLESSKSTSAINQLIDEEHYLKIVFEVKSKLEEEMSYSIGFENIVMQNCVITYKKGAEEEKPLLDDKIVSNSSEDFKVEVYIKVDNVLINSELTGNIVLRISDV